MLNHTNFASAAILGLEMRLEIYIKINKVDQNYISYIEIGQNIIIVVGPLIEKIYEIIDTTLKKKLKEVEKNERLNK